MKMHPITAVFVSALFCAALATLVVAQQAVSTALYGGAAPRAPAGRQPKDVRHRGPGAALPCRGRREGARQFWGGFRVNPLCEIQHLPGGKQGATVDPR